MGIIGNIKSFVTPTTTQAPQPATNTPTVPAKTVLIVEDEKMLSDALTAKLTHEGFEVQHADNGQAGLDMIKVKKPNIVLLDLMMPVMDGKTMLWKIREVPELKLLPVIVLTNSGTVENMKDTKTFLDASEFFVKSNVSLDDIVARIKTLT